MSEHSLSSDPQADRVVVEKKARRMILFAKGKAIKQYCIALGRSPEGPKTQEGDCKTPEGTYFIESRNSKSVYHAALRISYPNSFDIRRAKEFGVEPGGDIMIHGIRKGFGWIGRLHRFVDWTKGCIAVTNEEIEEILHLVPNGTPVEIRP
jgi:murein L,D-transpeptidase YafK